MAPLLDRASPMPTAHLRGPVGLQIQFASRSFIDEIAAATGADPVAFRPGRAPAECSESHFRNSSTVIRTGILASTTMRCL